MPSRRTPRRTDSDSRERLLAAGLELARGVGLRALTVRAVATRADANLGSFVYHFGTREAFIGELIERLYAPLFAGLQLSAAQAPDALTALRRTLLQFVNWVVEHRDFLGHLVMDAGAGEPGAQRFLGTLDQRHPALLLALIDRAQGAGVLQRAEPLHQLLFLMSTLAAPVLLLRLLGQRGIAPPTLVQGLAVFSLQPALIEQRLDWALRGLAAHPVEVS